MVSFNTKPGGPIPIGVSRHNLGTQFSVFSRTATQVTLHIMFSSRKSADSHVFKLDPISHRTGDIWHILIEGLPELFYYVYEIDGPWKPADGHIFDNRKRLIDPYAKAIAGMENWGQREWDSTGLAGLYCESEFDWEDDRPLDLDPRDLIIYETHVRGFTQRQNSGVRSPGTFKGVMEKLPYLKDLGINAIELLPINEFDELDCAFIHSHEGTDRVNYWGYDSINYFALKTGYSSGNSAREAIIEFKNLVKACHREGIEVILDVVFNHTGEGDNTRSTLSFKGFENSVYYMLDPSGDYLNYSGCGNTLNCNHPVVIDLILTALRHWVIEYHIDGFRFDLASAMTRNSEGHVQADPPVIEAIAKDPVLARTKLIAEAWDARGLYQVGTFPAYGRWMEWNGRYRDVCRRFLKGESGCVGEIATRIAGSEDLYGKSGRNPTHSINFVTSHDGFTMLDLVSYAHKHNLVNGENNQDGTNENSSLNFGIEGPTKDVTVMSRRMTQIRNMATLLMLSQGIPMIRAGDEFGQSQRGNNNAWCQDNDLTWLDWSLVTVNKPLFLFWKRLIAFRAQHPSFRRSSFFTGKAQSKSGLADISWHGKKPNQPEFNDSSRFLAFMVTEVDEDKESAIFVMMNFENHSLEVAFPPVLSHHPWTVVLSTSAPESFIAGQPAELPIEQDVIQIEMFSILVLMRMIQ